MAPSKKQRIAATANIKLGVHDLALGIFGITDTHLSVSVHPQEFPVLEGQKVGLDAYRP